MTYNTQRLYLDQDNNHKVKIVLYADDDKFFFFFVLGTLANCKIFQFNSITSFQYLLHTAHASRYNNFNLNVSS